MTKAVRIHTYQFNNNWYLPDLVENPGSHLTLEHAMGHAPLEENQPATGLLRGPGQQVDKAAQTMLSNQSIPCSGDVITEGRSLGKPGW